MTGSNPLDGYAIVEAVAPEQVEAVRVLLREYMTEQGLNPVSSKRAFEDLLNLPGRYRRPEGRLLLALQDGAPVGCGGLTDVVINGRVAPGWCEMKRVYLSPSVRGGGRGRALVQRLVDEARTAGYVRVVLSTRQRWVSALALYRAMGFRESEPFKTRPDDMADLTFMAIDL